MVKSPPTNGGDIRDDVDSIPGSEKGIVTLSRILARRVPCTEEPGGIQSMGVTESNTTEAT